MASGKLPPRQKMIGMMYLVLTALLAMNISKEVLNAFVLINDSLEKTNETFSAKNDVTYADFEMQYQLNKDKVKPFYDKAQEARNLSKDLVSYIDDLKFKLIRATDKIDDSVPNDSINLMEVRAKDNYDIPTNILIGSEPAKPKEGPYTAKELRAKIETFRSDLLNLLDEDARKNFKIGLVLDGRVENGVPKTWEVLNFDHTPLAATITVLSKIQTDVRNAEADVVSTLFSNITKSDHKFDNLVAKVIAPTSYVLLGEEYQADVFVAAYSSTQNPEILVGDIDTASKKIRGNATPVPVEGGVGTYKVKPTSEGLVKWGGIINVKKDDGTVDQFPFKAEYMVAKAGVVVSPTKMNVLYQSVDNPLDISVAGVPSEDLDVSISAGNIVKNSNGKYTVRITGGNKAVVSVFAKFGNEKKKMGEAEFRVKRVPDPVAKFGGKTGSANISRSDLTTALGLIADLENFDFNLKFQVISFDISVLEGQFIKTKGSNGNMVSPEQKDMLKNVKPGNKVFIENIKVKGEDGSIRDLSPINLKAI